MAHETYLSERDNQGKLKLLLSYKSRTLPVYSGKHILSGENVIFSWNKSVLFRKSITEVSLNHLLLIIDSNNFKLSSIRFYRKKDKVLLQCKQYYGETKKQSTYNFFSLQEGKVSIHAHQTK